MSAHGAVKIVEQAIRYVRAEAQHEHACAATLADTYAASQYVEARRKQAANLERCLAKLHEAMEELHK